MKTNYRKYKIKSTDTLLSIARENKLQVKDLVHYHNQYAESYDHIHKELPDFLREVILPLEGYGIVDGKLKWLNENIKEPSTLVEPLFGKVDLENPERDIVYGVLKTIISGKKENTLKYKVNLRYYSEGDPSVKKYISIDLVSEIFINDEEPSLIADELSTACIKTLYPLIVEVDNNLMLKDIVNHSGILKRWDKFKEDNSTYYQGEIAQDYFNLFEQSISTKDLFFDLLQNDWFYKAYFNDIYCVYYDNPELNYVEVDYPIIANTKNVQYAIEKKAEKIQKNGRVKIQINGKCTDLRNKLELERKSYFSSSSENINGGVNGKYRAVYFLGATHRHIESIFLFCDLKLDDLRSGTITISEIKGDSDMENHRHSKYVEDYDEVPKEEKKSFWKSLFS